MSDRAIVVVDAGSTRIQCLVFDSNGKVLVQGSTPWSYLDLGVPSPYARELDADGIWIRRQGSSRSVWVKARLSTAGLRRSRSRVSGRESCSLTRMIASSTQVRIPISGRCSKERPSTMRWANGSSVLRGGYRPFCLRPPSFAGSCSTNRTYTTNRPGCHAGGLAEVEAVGRACKRGHAGG